MEQKYRNGGLTSTFGKQNIAYIEPLCAGGGSEINAGLCHQPLPEILEDWRLKYNIDDFGEEELARSFEIIHGEIAITKKLDGLDMASLKIKEGAESLNWNTSEVSRFWKYTKNSKGSFNGTRQSMSETFIPLAISKGCQLLEKTKVKQLIIKGNTAKYALTECKNKNGDIERIKIN